MKLIREAEFSIEKKVENDSNPVMTDACRCTGNCELVMTPCYPKQKIIIIFNIYNIYNKTSLKFYK